MKNCIYWVGIYSICVFIHGAIHETVDFLNRKIEKSEKKNHKAKNQSYNIGSGKPGGPINRIGF